MVRKTSGEVIVDDYGVELQHFGYEHHGEKPTLVAINGLGSGVQPWGEALERIAAERHVVALDVRQAVGRCALAGVSTAYENSKLLTDIASAMIPNIPYIPDAPHMSDYGDEIIRSLYTHKIIEANQSVDMLGFSNGAPMIAQTAIDHPRKVNRMVMVGGAPGVVPWNFGGPGELPSQAAIAALGTPNRDSDVLDAESIKAIYGGELGNRPELTKELGIKRKIDEFTYNRQLWAAMASLYDWHDYITQTADYSWTPFTAWKWAFPAAKTLPRLAKTGKETLILAGADDPITPYKNMQILHAHLPNSQFKAMEYDDGQPDGHYGLLTNPKFSVAAISRFLNSRTYSLAA